MENKGNENLYTLALEKISTMSKLQIIISMIFGSICFLIAILLLYYVIFNSKIELSGENIVYILGGLFFSGIILIILPLYFGKISNKVQGEIIKEEIKQINFVSVLKELQNKFSDKEFLTPSRLVKTFRNWKDVFKINNSNDTTIVAVIEDDGEIQNFYIWSRDSKIQKSINSLDLKRVNDKEIKKWGYLDEHLVFQDPLDLCKDGKYKEAIDFLINILKDAKIIK